MTAILTIGLLEFTVLAWKERWWGRMERTFFPLVTPVAAAFAGFLLYSDVLSL